MDFDLAGKTVLVLAGGGGLGRAIANALASEGAKIALADVDEEAVNRTALELKGRGPSLFRCLGPR